ncbi:ralBP1-associated Eps domain-containing protein 1-like isoform X2 [Anneissia japonica]|uniref:ralBP1-associated Eps domain-containing protein 1-like isoform X2 n=1 Tax=Anneissia japonica TaxID=1529436 RepID=UPI001425AA2B|nr:ralBP1-associated Eps domain-containing protein 1-like isoform X2 [Anneissia japonica]
MEGTLLTPTEQQFYSDWFSSCDQENSGKLMWHQVSKLFMSSQLNQDVLQKITELCGAIRVGHFGRSQFFLALKLIAMVQNGYQMPTSIEGLYSGIDVPLPKFATSRSNIVDQAQPKKDIKTISAEDKPVQPSSNEMRQMEFVNPAFMDHTTEFEAPADKSQNRQPGQFGGLPAPPSKSHVRNASSGGLPGMLQTRIPAATGSGSNENSPSTTPPLLEETKVVSPRSKTMDRMPSVPAPAHCARKVVDRQASFPVRPEGGWANFSHPPVAADNIVSAEGILPAKVDNSQNVISEISDGIKDAGEQNGQENVWQISDEQRQYYSDQFRTLQPDLSGLIQGAEAKQFFEKSKLPTTELSKIWQLSDVNKDGALCLEEFCTAMHLSVLRKHKYELPDKLPPCLVPKMDEGLVEDVEEVEVVKSVATTKKVAPAPPDVTNRSVTPPGLGVDSSPKSRMKAGENWAKFSDSPFPGPSPSTEGPANFDFASISPDPESKIVQPIPLKLAPDGQTCAILPSDPPRDRKYSDPGSVTTPDDEEHLIPAKQRSSTLPDSAGNTPARIAPPPPVERKASAPTIDLGDNAKGLISRHRPRSYSSGGIRTKHIQQPAAIAYLKRAKFQQKRYDMNRQSWEGALDIESQIDSQSINNVTDNNTSGEAHAESAFTDSNSNVETRPDPKQEPRPDPPRPHPNHDFRPNPRTEPSSQLPRSDPVPVPTEIASHNPQKMAAHSQQPTIPPVPPKAAPVKVPPRVTTDSQIRKQNKPGLVRSATVGHSARPSHGKSASTGDAVMSPPQIPPRPTENKKNSISSRNSSSLYSSSDYNSSNSSDEDNNEEEQDDYDEEKGEPKSLHNFADFSRFDNETTDTSKHNKYTKSMSLDYRLMGRQQKIQDHAFPPVPPPRPVITEIRDALQGNKPQTIDTPPHKERHASGDDLLSTKTEDYAKERTRHQSAPLPLHVQDFKSSSRKSIQERIRKVKEENTKLSRLNIELQQELKELTQDRIDLEIQINKLKPFSTS